MPHSTFSQTARRHIFFDDRQWTLFVALKKVGASPRRHSRRRITRKPLCGQCYQCHPLYKGRISIALIVPDVWGQAHKSTMAGLSMCGIRKGKEKLLIPLPFSCDGYNWAMLDYRRLRNEPEFVEESLVETGAMTPLWVDEWLAVGARWRERPDRRWNSSPPSENRISKRFPQRKRQAKMWRRFSLRCGRSATRSNRLRAQKREQEAQRERSC